MNADSRGKRGTCDDILDVAERLVQVLGFNGFSYADIAGELTLTNAAIHYHFPSKEDLGARLVDRYAQRFFAALDQLTGAALTADAQLTCYLRLHEEVVAGGRMCLCGMMIAELETLPKSITDRLMGFSERNEAWLAHTIEAGRARGELSFDDDPRRIALSIVATLQGAMVMAKTGGGVRYFKAAAETVVDALCPRQAGAAPLRQSNADHNGEPGVSS